MEQRHILRGEEMVAQQQERVQKLVRNGHEEAAAIGVGVLGALRESLELARARLRDLQARYPDP
jgi:hypothetical protein